MPLPPHGAAQATFMEKTRREIFAKGRSHFEKKNWSRIEPLPTGHVCLNSNRSCGLDPDIFCVKPLAVWVPHMLLPNCVHCCPHCTPDNGPHKQSVDVSNAKRTKGPKTMHGVREHRCLDTVQHKCNDCRQQFAGHHPRLMKLDAKKVIGIVTFFSKGFAADDACHGHMTNHLHDAMASTCRRLSLCVTDDCLDGAQFCHQACHEKKARGKAPRLSEADSWQPTIQHLLMHMSEKAKRRQTVSHGSRNKKLSLKQKREALEGDAEFLNVFWQKSNWNNLNLPFVGI